MDKIEEYRTLWSNLLNSVRGFKFEVQDRDYWRALVNAALSPDYSFQDCLEGEYSVMEGSGGAQDRDY